MIVCWFTCGIQRGCVASVDRERLNQRAKQHEQGLVSDVSVRPAKSSEIPPRESAIEIGANQREREKEKSRGLMMALWNPKLQRKRDKNDLICKRII